jgi:hypothetical protein
VLTPVPLGCHEMPAQTIRIDNIVWKLHEQQSRKTELTELRKRYLERACAAHVDSDKKLKTAQAQSGLQRAFLKRRLESCAKEKEMIKGRGTSKKVNRLTRPSNEGPQLCGDLRWDAGTPDDLRCGKEVVKR